MNKDFNALRGKEVPDDFRQRVLEREHQAVSALRQQVDYLITREYAFTKV